MMLTAFRSFQTSHTKRPLQPSGMSSPDPAQSPPPEALPAVTGNGHANINNNNNGVSKNAPPSNSRRTSLGFLRRAKSNEPLGDRKASGGRISKKAQKELAKEEELRRQREAAVPRHAPKLPDFSPAPQLKTFGGENARPDSVAIISNRVGHNEYPQAISIPPVPGSSSSAAVRSTDSVDPYARTESMTHRGRYSYASSAVSTINSPRRVRRRKDPTPYK